MNSSDDIKVKESKDDCICSAADNQSDETDLADLMGQALLQIKNSDWLEHNTPEKFKADHPEVIAEIKKTKESGDASTDFDLAEILSFDDQSIEIIGIPGASDGQKDNQSDETDLADLMGQALLQIKNSDWLEHNTPEKFKADHPEVIAEIKKTKESGDASTDFDLAEILSFDDQSIEIIGIPGASDGQKDNQSDETDLADLMGQALLQIKNSDWLEHNTPEKFKADHPEVIAEIKKTKESGDASTDFDLAEILSFDDQSIEIIGIPGASDGQKDAASTEGDEIVDLMKQIVTTLRKSDLSQLSSPNVEENTQNTEREMLK